MALNSPVATWRVVQLVSDGQLGHSQLGGVADPLRSPQSHLKMPCIATHIDARGWLTIFELQGHRHDITSNLSFDEV